MFDHPLLDFGERCALAGFVTIADRARLWESIGAVERVCSPGLQPTEGVLSIDGIGPGRWDGWRGHIATVTASLPVTPDQVEEEQSEVVREMTAVFGEPHLIRGQRDNTYRWQIEDWTVEVGIDGVERNRVELTVADRELLAR